MEKYLKYFYFFLFSIPVFSQTEFSVQNLKFTHIGPAQGLDNPRITDLFQDSYGFIWIGTQYGVYRYDGYECTPLTNAPYDSTSISANYIAYHAFYENKDSNLFIATLQNGLNLFDRRSEKFIRYIADVDKDNWLTINEINTISGDGNGGLWIGTIGGGLNYFDTDANTFKQYWIDRNDYRDTLTGDGTIITLLLDKKNILWIGTALGLSRFDPEEKHFERYFPDAGNPNSLSSNFVTHILEDSKGRIWIGSLNGLNLWNNGNFEQFYPNEQIFNRKGNYNYITKLYEDKEGMFWAGTQGGLLNWQINETGIAFTPILHDPTKSTSIGKGAIHGIIEDSSGNLMFGTENGVSILNKTSVQFMDIRFSKLQEELLSFDLNVPISTAVEVENKIWFGNDKGLFVYQQGKPLIQVLKDKVTALYNDKKGKVYVGTVESAIAFFIFDSKSEAVIEEYERSRGEKDFINPKKFVGSRIESFVEDYKGFIWIGARGTLTRFDTINKKFQRFSNDKKDSTSLTNTAIYDLLIDKNNQLWIATGVGLNKLDSFQLRKPIGEGLMFEHYKYAPRNNNSLSSNIIYCLYESEDGQIWIGTETGLNIFDPYKNKWDRIFKEESGLPDNKIVDIIVDDKNIFWFSTANNGISRFDGHQFRNLSFEDGIHANYFKNKASFKMEDGTLIFCSTGGVNAFRPENIVIKDTISTPVYFVDLQILNQSIRPGTEDDLLEKAIYLLPDITFEFSQRVFSFKIAALDFAHPNKQQYRYWLESFGRDTTWVELGNNRLIPMSNLLPGKYYLHIQASKDGQKWLSSKRPLQFVVRPPWWGSLWALLIYILVVLSIIYIIYSLRLRQKLATAEKQRLQEIDEIKNRLYINITHEFRSPLTVILGEIDRLREKADSSTRNVLKIVTRNGHQLLNLINQMLDLAKLESGSLKLKIIQSDVIHFLKYVLESFHVHASDKNISLHFFSTVDTFLMDHDPERLQQIVSNLLSNALKFTPSGGEIYLKADLTNLSFLKLVVEDTGKGIPHEELQYIFDRFYQVDDSITRQAEGTGIGLAITKELIKLFNGQIEVESEIEKGTSFTVFLPITQNAKLEILDEEMLLVPPDASPTTTEIKEQKKYITSATLGQPSVLIIEDNADVVRYISMILQDHYQLLTTTNGIMGLEKAKQQIPDLIISDVMMPELDGYEVCKRLKNDSLTSHIPIVLLTARADIESKIEGLNYGADAYLPKPFYKKELIAILDNLLKNREKLRKYYTSGGFISDRENRIRKKGKNNINSHDIAFLDKILNVVEVHLDDANLSAEKLAKLLHMSYDNVYKKIKALTGMGVTEYIRHIRLHKAAKLLKKNSGMTITQIALEVGFNRLNFFSREFKKVFGVSPLAYKKMYGKV